MKPSTKTFLVPTSVADLFFTDLNNICLLVWNQFDSFPKMHVLNYKL